MNEKDAILKLPGGLLAHHAYAIEGGEKTREELFKLLEDDWGIATKGNPDFSYQKFATMSIGEARALKETAGNKAFGGSKKIFVIEANAITAEAQNSLLKIFEEPTKDTHFFVLGNCVKNLIPTLESRVLKIRADNGAAAPSEVAAADFLRAPLSKRLLLAKKLADDIKDEKKTKADAISLVNDIERLLYDRNKKTGAPPEKFFEELERCRSYLSDPSAGVKMLLEYAALIVPRID